MATVTPGMAANQAAQGQITTAHSTMTIEGLQRIGRTGRLKAAGGAQTWAEQKSVGADQEQQSLAGQVQKVLDHQLVSRALAYKLNNCV